MRTMRAGLAAGLMLTWLVSTSWAEPTLLKLKRVWASSGATIAETDSLAACRTADGVRLMATCKAGHRIDIFDAATGRFLQSLGKKGSGPGEFDRPNGVATWTFAVAPAAAATGGGQLVPTPVLFVVERDNHRVQAFHAQSLAPLGLFGAAELRQPYGIAIAEHEGAAQVWITDAKAPPGQQIRRYRVTLAAGRLSAELTQTFGDVADKGRIRTPESITADVGNGRLLICDEDDGREAVNVKVYDLAGNFTGKTFADGMVVGEPEGIVVAGKNGKEDDKSGVIILTDQRKNLSVWHVFDRQTLRYSHSFTGEPTVANTDGICLFSEPFGDFPGGAFFAVNDDADIHAYRLNEILNAPAGKAN